MKRKLLLTILCLLMIFPIPPAFAADPSADKPSLEQTAQQAEKDEDEDEDKKKAKDGRRIIESVTVTATRVETDLMKTPIAVSAFDQDTLDQQGVQTVRDLANMVPNMDIATINGQSTPIISMRGVRSTNETELGDPAVGVHLDGIYSPRMQGVLAMMFDNERVEVLRGPQGTLFGRNSTVGNINIISAKPKFDRIDGKVTVAPGNYNAKEMQGMFNMPVTDTFAFRVASRYYKRDSYIDGYWDPNQYDQRYINGLVADADVINPTSGYTRTQHSNWWIGFANGDPNIRELVPADPSDFYFNANEYAFRVSGRYKATDNVTFDLSYQKFRNNSAGGVDLVNAEKLRGRPVRDETGAVIGLSDASTLFPEDDTYQAVVNVPGRFYLDIQYLRSNLTWDINNDLTFIYQAGYEHQDRESAQDMEQSLNAWDGAMFFLPGTGSESYMHEVQLQSYSDKKFNFIVGANVFHEQTSTFGYYDNPINDKSLWDQPNRASDAWAVFGQGTYAVNDRLHLTVGLRHSDETKEDVGGRTFIGNNDNGVAPGWWERFALNDLPTDIWHDRAIYPEFNANDNKGSWSHNDWRLGVDYDMNEDTLLYSYLATGFKAGGIGDVFRDTNPRTGEEIHVATAFDPEEVTTLELGFKTRLLDGRMNLRGAYFFSDYEQMQYASVGAVAFTERWEALRDSLNQIILDENGEPTFGWVTAPLTAYYTQNVPGAEIQGFEFEYDLVPWTGGRIYGYATWLDTEITEDWITKWDYDPVAYFGISYEESIDPNNGLLEVNLKGNELAVSPEYKLHLTAEHAFILGDLGTIQPWTTVHWEDDSYLTIWNVDKHVDDLDFVIADEDIRFTDDKREAYTTLNGGIRFFQKDWVVEVYGYNLTNEIVQYWGGAAEGVAKGSFSMPRTYGLRISYDF
ncbi:TonB-dependent receptor [Acanthopleuribacter pedis]|uniref:TonB-dependent receptor n=1 Tax=Acanthopleuribacter pedis TaxID=442870 RepID=A0A8J7Q8J3_9BACT|nr:TonB-dependent receptor [Acanthopleuribacter pedis]MBO1320476.1 TonB-dependent receptor [Acanthopleuribacter pedis]